MMRITVAMLSMTVILVGCSNPQSGPPASSVSNAYPTSAASVTSDTAYKKAFTSGLSGTTYYVRRLSKDEVSKMPKERVKVGETDAVVFIPIKDGKIVEPSPVDLAGSFMSQSPEKMLEMVDSK